MRQQFLGAAIFLLPICIAGCANACESVQNEIEKIDREIQADPFTGMERGEELKELQGKLDQMDCVT